ncbi:MAG: biotin--[acetyl-CoA-carboxylase] ligase [Pleurocapsa minor GSE-CHR-MK-17-07R]|jgi:BirA family biotin operon repressor/biotin-[acetyl-CoA-carboxylase] ligase|nr:biotin--[acetyl-CoA-carboxylase] ligase [Pleurocapsa minor GSE-CHR-MK 17-07R]
MSDLSHARLAQLPGTRSFRYFDDTPSTNTIGLAWLAAGCPDGSIVVADEQTAGRGRLGRSWFAPPGSALMFTYLFHPPRELAVRATMLGALAVLQALQASGISGLGIKYPNDVQIGGKKVCGVLAEAAWNGDSIGVALGIGLNVRINFEDTPFRETAISAETALGRTIDRAQLLQSVLERLDFWRVRMAEPALFHAWRDALNMLNTRVQVSTAEGPVAGIARDVSPDGALLIEHDDGHIHVVTAGDILVITSP